MHHIIQKNKRLVGGVQPEPRKRPPSGNARQPSFKSRPPSEQYQRLISTSKPEVRQILETVSSIENDLRLRVQMYGKDSTSTMECLQHYVKTCNDYGVHLIKNQDFIAAAEILMQCEQVLISNGAGNYPALKFQTYNNIAHCHNVQGNVRLSMKYLMRALEFGVEAEQQSQGQSQLPLVETYLNIANAHMFLGMLDQALEQAENALYTSQQQLDHIMSYLDNPDLSPEQREQFGQQYHSQINLHVMSFQSKGQILEKMKRYEEAIVEYQQGKSVVEANYGTQHPKYVELANAMNGAKLRTKYIQPAYAPQQEGNRSVSHQQLENASTINILTQDNVFMREQEMMKPISQQKARRKILRPSSAKPPKQQSSSGSVRHNSKTRGSSKGFNQSTEQIYQSRTLQSLNLQKQSSSGCEWHNHKDRSRSPKQHMLNKKDFQIKIRPNSARKSRKVMIKNSQHFKDLQNSHASSIVHSTSDCNNCHIQLEEIRQMHIEQQRLMNTIMQNQISNQSQIPPQGPQQQFSPHQNTPPQGPNPFYQYPPPPYYYPYPMPPPHGMYPPPPYPYPYPPYQAPPPYASFSPTINNFMHQTQKSDSSKNAEHPHYPAYPGFNLHQLPPQPRYGQSNHDAQSITTLTELNERDSGFIEMTNKLNSARGPQHLLKEVQQPIMPQQPREQKLPEIVKEQENKPKLVKEQPKEQKKEEKPEVDIVGLKKKMHESAIKIQTYFRQYRFQRLYKLMTSLNKRNFLFHKQMIAYREDSNNKGKVMILNVSLISIRKGKKFIPETVVFEFYKRKSKKLVMEVTHKIKAFGFNNPDKTNKVDVFNRVKAFLSQLRLKGQTLNSLRKQFLENVGVYDQNYSKIDFMDPGYFNEGLQLIKNVQIEDKPKQKKYESSSEDEKQESFKEESIQDEYSIHEEPEVSDHEKSLELKRKQQAEKDLDKIKMIIKIQSHIRRYLSNINLQYRLKGAKGGNLVYACVKRHDHYFLVKARILTNIHKQKTYSFVVSFKENPTQVKPFTVLLKTIPVQDLEIIEFIEKAIEIKYDAKNRVITEVSFDPSYKPEQRSFEMTQNDLTYQQSLNKKQKMAVEMVTKDKPKMTIDQAVLVIQTRFRCFLAQRRRAMLIQQEVICSFIYRVGDNVAHVMVKKENKNKKYEILVRNCKGKKKTTTIKTKDMPFERYCLEEALREALEIKWNKDGTEIDKVKYDHKKVNIQKIKDNVNLQIEEIKDQRKEYEEMLKTKNQQQQVVEEKKEEKVETEEPIDEEVYSEHDFDQDFDQEESKQQFSVQLEESTPRPQEEKKIETPKKTEQPKTKPISKKQQEQSVVKAQALIKGAVTRNQVKPLMKKNHTMLMRVCRKLSNGRWYLIFLIKKPESAVKSTSDGFYLITMRQADNLNEIYDLEITLDMAKKIFGRKNSTKEDLQSRVMFETNQHEFQLMLECLDIKEEDDFSLDFQKFRKLQSEKQGIQLFDNTYAPVESMSMSKSKHQKEEVKQPKDYDVIQEDPSYLEQSPDPRSKAKTKEVDKKPTVVLKKREYTKAEETKAAVTIQRRARKFLTKKQALAVNRENFTNKDKDPKKKLALKEKGVLKLSGMHFMYFVYTDSYEQEIKFTLKSVREKVTVASLKNIALADFGEENLDVQDVIEYVKEKLTENEEELLIDEKTGGIRKDWQKQLHEFIETSL